MLTMTGGAGMQRTVALPIAVGSITDVAVTVAQQ